ncbi:helix-turn-helix domain-containing protein [Oricola sp.]|uniref:helix-turn-helix domain-containing protein n=1 Tax=Oricola sp. TaxID=1979950 RepID=UPI003BA86A19
MTQLTTELCDPLGIGFRSLVDGVGDADTDPCRQPNAAAMACRDPIAACDAVVDLLSVFFNVSGRQIRSPGRASQSIARVRQIGMYIAHVTLGLRMSAIGDGFNRDKSTVVHACHTIEDLRDDPDFDLIVARAERLILIAFSLEADRGPYDV